MQFYSAAKMLSCPACHRCDTCVDSRTALMHNLVVLLAVKAECFCVFYKSQKQVSLAYSHLHVFALNCTKRADD